MSSLLGSLSDYLKPKKLTAEFPGQEGGPGEQEPDMAGDDSENMLVPAVAPSAPRAISSGAWDDYMRKQKTGV